MNAQKANNTIDKVRQLQRKLYLSAKANSKRRYHALYDKVYRTDILMEAWKRVKSNGGVGGIDRITIMDIESYGVEKFLVEIQKELINGTYHPLPVRRCYIPKNDGKGSKRPLGIPVVKDRVVQMATKIVVEPVFEADFKDCSYGFRPKRNAHQALKAINEEVNKGCLWVIDADIKEYFCSINHEKLMLLVKQRISDRRILKLISKWLKAGVMENGKIQESIVGSPQGGVISPLLSNIYLHYFDYLWGKKYSHLGRLIRYADDFVVICKGWENAKFSMRAIKEIMRKLELKLHPDKTRFIDLWNSKEGFDFLGFHHRWKKGKTKNWKKFWDLYQYPSQKAMKKMRQNIKQVFQSRATLLLDVKDLIEILNPKIVGMRNYYSLRFSYHELCKIDWYIKKKFTIWHNRKRQKSHRHCRIEKVCEIIYKQGLKRLAVVEC
ncbi:group II intron reverse transcriptase/maturase [Clostridium formicaceticum]|uniref:Group II intron reverse transcriptase/maturase n=1 Tax=Clostridium formicaceticum TaxID=1497 RepID=A0ABN4T8W0_9CLOT|nr:group II intron reverse transcriptase/maturase [Clostridium formicaceticum]AOY77507.1 group II intron reverse transcriptase/maturase [Clostridium formicaceticum]